jgi:phage-related minor tail protein
MSMVQDIAVLRLTGDANDFTQSMVRARASVNAELKGMTTGAQKALNDVLAVMDQLEVQNARMASAIGMMGSTSSRGMRKQAADVAASVGQTTQAIRMLPAQLSDVATQLAGGQNPFLVLMQQGLQTRDMFGSFGGMFRGIASVMTPVTVGFGALAVGVGGATAAFIAGSAESDRMARSMALTRNAAGLTMDGYMRLGDEVQAASGATIGMSREAAEAAVSMGLTGRATTDVARAIAVYAKTADITTEKSTALFGGIGKDALGWAVNMTEKTNFLTLSTYNHVKALQDQGRGQEAAAVAAAALADSLSKTPPQLGWIETLLESGSKKWSEYWNAAKNVGRQETVQDKLDEVQAKLQRGKNWADQIPRLRGEEANLQELVRLEQRQSSVQAMEAAQNKAQIAAARYREEMIKSLDPMRERARRLDELNRNVQALVGTENAWTAAQIARARQEIILQTQDQRAVADAQALADLRLAKITDTAARETRVLEQRAATLEDLRKQDLVSARQALQEQTQIEVERAQVQLRAAQAQRDLLKSRPVGAEAGASQRREAEMLRLQADIAAAQAAADRAVASGAASLGQIDLAESREAMQQWASMYTRMLSETETLTEQTGLAQAKALINPVEIARAEAEAAIAKIRRDTRKVAAEVRLLIDMLRARGDDKQADALQKRLDVFNEAAQQREISERVKVEAEISRKAMEEWQKAADKIGDALTDALMRGFEGGKGAAQNLRDTVTNMFKTMVLRPAIQSVMQPMANSITGAVGQALGGQFGGGGIGSSLGQMAGMGAGIWGSSAMYGAAIGTTSIGAGSQAAMLAAQTGAFGAEGAALTAAAAGNAGAAGIMGSIGAAVPYLAAAAAIYAIVKTLDTSGTMHGGFASTYSAAGGVGELQGPTAVAGYANTAGFERKANVAPLTNAIAQGVGQMLDATAQTFGKAAGYTVATAFADDSSKDGAWGSLRIAIGDAIVSDWSQGQMSKWAPKTFADGQAGQEQYVAAVAKDVRAALNAIGLPTWASKMLDQLGEGATIEQLGTTVQRINEIKGALQSLGEVLPALANLSDDAKMAFINAAGGIQALAASVQTYEQRILSEAERSGLQAQRVAEAFKRLGVAMPANKEGFKSLVKGIDTTTTAGQSLLAGVLGLAGSFADMQDAMGQLGNGIEDEINRIRGLLEEDSAQGLVALQAKFAMTTAAARAGDQNAINALPSVSKALLDRAREEARTAQDLARMQAQVMFSLQDTLAIVRAAPATAAAAAAAAVTAVAPAAPAVITPVATPAQIEAQIVAGSSGSAASSGVGDVFNGWNLQELGGGYASGGDFGGGMRLVGEQGPELEVTGPSRIYNAAQTAEMLSAAMGAGGDQSALLAELAALRAEVSALRQESMQGTAVVAGNSRRLVQLIERVSQDGDALSTRAVT